MKNRNTPSTEKNHQDDADQCTPSVTISDLSPPIRGHRLAGLSGKTTKSRVYLRIASKEGTLLLKMFKLRVKGWEKDTASKRNEEVSLCPSKTYIKIKSINNIE